MRWSVVQELLKGDAAVTIYPTLFRPDGTADRDAGDGNETIRGARWKLLSALARADPRCAIVQPADDVIFYNFGGSKQDEVFTIQGSELLSWIEPDLAVYGDCIGEPERHERRLVTRALRDVKDACEVLFENEDITRILKAHFDAEDQPHAGVVVVGAPEAV